MELFNSTDNAVITSIFFQSPLCLCLMFLATTCATASFTWQNDICFLVFCQQDYPLTKWCNLLFEGMGLFCLTALASAEFHCINPLHFISIMTSNFTHLFLTRDVNIYIFRSLETVYCGMW